MRCMRNNYLEIRIAGFSCHPPPKKRFYSSLNYLYFPRDLFTKKVKDSCHLVQRREALYCKNASVLASLALEERMHESIWIKEFLQEMVLFHDVCMVCNIIYPAKDEHSWEREHPLSTLISFRFHRSKYSNSDKCEWNTTITITC